MRCGSDWGHGVTARGRRHPPSPSRRRRAGDLSAAPARWTSPLRCCCTCTAVSQMIYKVYEASELKPVLDAVNADMSKEKAAEAAK